MEHEQVPPSHGMGTIEDDVGSEVYAELVADFLSQLPGFLIHLNAAAAVSDVPAARYVAHQIKGNALSFGAVDLDGLADRVLAIGKDRDELLRPLVAEIETEVGNLQTRLGSVSLETELGSEAYQQLLSDLLGHLPIQLADLKAAADAGDISSARYIAHHIKGHPAGLGVPVLSGLADRLLQVRMDEGALLRRIVGEIEQAAGRLQAELGVRTLESDVGSELYQELVMEFLGQFPLQLSALHNAALMRDVPAARYVAHQIKGHALSFGAIRLDGLADRVLRIGKDESDLLPLLVGEIDVEVARVQATLGR